MSALIEVMNPVAEQKPEQVMPAERLENLNDKKIVLWWNGKPKGDIALRAVGDVIEHRFPGSKCLFFSCIYQGRGSAVPEEYEALLKAKPDAVIASTGD